MCEIAKYETSMSWASHISGLSCITPCMRWRDANLRTDFVCMTKLSNPMRKTSVPSFRHCMLCPLVGWCYTNLRMASWWPLQRNGKADIGNLLLWDAEWKLGVELVPLSKIPHSWVTLRLFSHGIFRQMALFISKSSLACRAMIEVFSSSTNRTSGADSIAASNRYFWASWTFLSHHRYCERDDQVLYLTLWLCAPGTQNRFMTVWMLLCSNFHQFLICLKLLICARVFYSSIWLRDIGWSIGDSGNTFVHGNSV